MSITGCRSIRAVGKCFHCPSERARLSRCRCLNCRLPGTARRRSVSNRKNTLGKNSFSLLQQLPHTEEAAGAEAGSQRKVNSKINELGKGNREAEKKKQPRNYVSNLPRCARGGKNLLSRKGSENKGRPKLGEH